MRKRFCMPLLLLFLLLQMPIHSSAECQHVWSDWIIEVQATCGDEGEQYRYCTLCEEEEYQEIPATGNHKWTAWKTTEEPSCNDTGHRERECTVCHEYEEEEVAAYGTHDWGAWVTIDEPDCSSTGEAERVCNRCGESEYKTLAKTSHTYGSWVVTKEATAFAKGTKERECKICGYVQTKSIAKVSAATATTSSEKAVLKVVNNLFTYAMSYDVEKMATCYKNPENVTVFADSSLIKLAKKYNTKYLKMSPKSIKVNGTSATVKVYCQYMDFEEAFLQAYFNLYSYPDIASASESTILKRYISQIKKCIKSVGGTKQYKTLTINLKKSSGKWKITTTSTALMDALNMGYYSAEELMGL